MLSWVEETIPRLNFAEGFYIGILKPFRNYDTRALISRHGGSEVIPIRMESPTMCPSQLEARNSEIAAENNDFKPAPVAVDT